MKKFISALLSIVMVVVIIPVVGVSALTEGYYTYTVTNGKAAITTVNTSISGDVVIPNTLGGYPVTSIRRQAFQYCNLLTDVVIPNNITSIGERAFFSCDSLESVTINDGVISIGDEAFSSCDVLFNVDFGNSLTSIGSYVFSGSHMLRYITIPDCLENIGEYAFGYGLSLTKVIIEISNLQEWCSKGNSHLLQIAPTKIEFCINGETTTDIVIPDNVTYISDYSFFGCKSLTSISIPNSITKIGNYAFYNCTGLSSITIPDSITDIGEGAFMCCDNLTSVNITDLTAWCNISFFDEFSNPLSCTENLYLNGELLRDLEIPDNVSEIGAWAFVNCKNFSSITIPNNVESIGNNTFMGCENLTTVNITDLTAWCNINFFDGSSNPLYYAENLYLNGELINDLEIPNDVTKIGDWSFFGYDNLKNLIIPNNVTTIGKHSFRGCLNLTGVTIPFSVTSIEECAFYSCGNLETVSIPRSVTNICENAFGYCYNIIIVYYGGDKDEWTGISVDKTNTELIEAEYFHYNATDLDNHYIYTVTQEPSCTETGKGMFICPCGYSKDEQRIPMLGHDIVQHEGKLSTCTEIGYKEYKTCSRCDYTTYAEIPTNDNHIGETEIREARKATVTSDGYTGDTYCKDCGKKIADGEVIPKLITYGDVTGDSKINLTDVSTILKHIAKWDIEINTDAADVNCDGKVNLTDVSTILKYIAKWDVVLGK